MSVQLEIRDGDPWWLSPDIWVVPGTDPDGPAGVPVAGSSNFVWARIANHGSSPAANATVRFYWCDPSVGVLRSLAHLIGTAFVTMGPGAVQEVLCLTPWVASWVNDGHECLVAEVFHPSDPLPSPTPDNFSATSYRHVAQRNVTVVKAHLQQRTISVPLMVPRMSRQTRTALTRLRVRPWDTLDKEMLVNLGLHEMPVAGPLSIEHAGLTIQRSLDEEAVKRAVPELELAYEKETHAGISLTVLLPQGIQPGHATVIDVTQESDGKVLGGYSVFLALPPGSTETLESRQEGAP